MAKLLVYWGLGPYAMIGHSIGDSLNIVQLNTRLKKVLKQDIPVAAMFNYLLVDSFARCLDPRQQVGRAAAEIDRGDELEKNKKRMRARTRKPLPDEVME